MQKYWVLKPLTCIHLIYFVTSSSYYWHWIKEQASDKFIVTPRWNINSAPINILIKLLMYYETFTVLVWDSVYFYLQNQRRLFITNEEFRYTNIQSYQFVDFLLSALYENPFKRIERMYLIFHFIYRKCIECEKWDKSATAQSITFSNDGFYTAH